MMYSENDQIILSKLYVLEHEVLVCGIARVLGSTRHIHLN